MYTDPVEATTATPEGFLKMSRASVETRTYAGSAAITNGNEAIGVAPLATSAFPEIAAGGTTASSKAGERKRIVADAAPNVTVMSGPSSPEPTITTRAP